MPKGTVSQAHTKVDTIKFQQKRLAKCQLRHSELDKLIQRIYEDNVLGKISDSRFATLCNQYEQEQHDTTQEIDQLQADISTYKDASVNADSFLKLAIRYTEFTELTPAMLHEFVDRIEIHERTEKRVRSTTQQIDIHLNFIGRYAPSLEYMTANQPEPKSYLFHKIGLTQKLPASHLISPCSWRGRHTLPEIFLFLAWQK